MKIRVFGIIGTLVASLSFAFAVHAQEAVQTPSAAPASIIQGIRKGRAALTAILAERVKSKPQPYAVANAMTANVTIAVWSRATDALTIVEAKKFGDELTVTSGPKLPIRVTYSGKLYSRYALPPETESYVVGVIYPVLTKKTVGKKVSYEARDTVYVPYDSAFYVPEVLSAGSDYLSFLIQDAYDELREKKIMSRAFPDKLLADVIDPYLAKSIAVIEHSDHASLLAEDDPERTVGRFLVKLASNEDGAFDAAISSAGAAGLVQFIPSTYALMVQKRPDLGLIPDFRAGMADHQNAVKAQVAYLDMDLAGMPTIRAMYETDKAGAGEYLAAAYNGGSTRVKRAYTAFGAEWARSFKKDMASAQSDAATLKKRIASLQKQVDAGKDIKTAKASLAAAKREREEAVVKIATITKSSLREETVWYVAKLKKAYGMFTAGYFATPKAPSGALPVIVPASETETGSVPAIPVAAAGGAAPVVCFSEGGCSMVQ